MTPGCIGVLFATGAMLEKREIDRYETLPRSGAWLRDGCPFPRDAVDDLIVAGTYAFDREMGLAPGTSRWAMLGVRVEYTTSYRPGEMGLRHRPGAAGELDGITIRPSYLKAMTGPGDSDLLYEQWRRMLRVRGDERWDVDNRKGSPERWPGEWFAVIAAVNGRFR